MPRGRSCAAKESEAKDKAPGAKRTRASEAAGDAQTDEDPRPRISTRLAASRPQESSCSPPKAKSCKIKKELKRQSVEDAKDSPAESELDDSLSVDIKDEFEESFASSAAAGDREAATASSCQVPADAGPVKHEREILPRLARAEDVTEGRCGRCHGCSRSACMECTACKRRDFDECIDLYCVNQKAGLSEREALREMYFSSLKKKNNEEPPSQRNVGATGSKSSSSSSSSSEEDSESDASGQRSSNQSEGEKEDDQVGEESSSSRLRSKAKVLSIEKMERYKKLSIAEKVNLVMDSIHSQSSKHKAKKQADRKTALPVVDDDAPTKDERQVSRRYLSTVYGGSERAGKIRRCGECEGCTRDDCGSCAPCKSKPRFGGTGSMKKACVERYCRMKSNKQSASDSTLSNESDSIIYVEALP